MEMKYEVTVTAIGNLARTFLMNNQSVILLDDRQLQRQIGDGDHTGVVIGDLLSKLLLRLRVGVGSHSGTRVLQQALGFLPGAAS